MTVEQSEPLIGALNKCFEVFLLHRVMNAGQNLDFPERLASVNGHQRPRHRATRVNALMAFPIPFTRPHVIDPLDARAIQHDTHGLLVGVLDKEDHRLGEIGVTFRSWCDEQVPGNGVILAYRYKPIDNKVR